MPKINFYNLDEIEESKLTFVVMMARYRDKWVFVRHRQRITWEIPGGHIERNEKVLEAASRELQEESGAREFKLTPICIYSVERLDDESYGQLFYVEISEMGQLPDSEIGEVRLFDKMPNDLTYPLIQPFLYDKVIEMRAIKND